MWPFMVTNNEYSVKDYSIVRVTSAMKNNLVFLNVNEQGIFLLICHSKFSVSAHPQNL